MEIELHGHLAQNSWHHLTFMYIQSGTQCPLASWSVGGLTLGKWNFSCRNPAVPVLSAVSSTVTSQSKNHIFFHYSQPPPDQEAQGLWASWTLYI